MLKFKCKLKNSKIIPANIREESKVIYLLNLRQQNKQIRKLKKSTIIRTSIPGQPILAFSRSQILFIKGLIAQLSISWKRISWTAWMTECQIKTWLKLWMTPLKRRRINHNSKRLHLMKTKVETMKHPQSLNINLETLQRMHIPEKENSERTHNNSKRQYKELNTGWKTMIHLIIFLIT